MTLKQKIEQMLLDAAEPDWDVEYWDSGNFDDAYQIGVTNGTRDGFIDALLEVLRLIKMGDGQ